MNRRGFLSSILAAAAAPTIVRASSLMRVSGIVIPTTAEVAQFSTGMVRAIAPFQADLNFTSMQMLEDIEAFSFRVMRPAIQAIREQIDADIVRRHSFYLGKRVSAPDPNG